MSMLPAGFTRLDNDTDVATLLSLPNALVQPYLFLLARARLSRAGAHWGEVAAAVNRSQTQTHLALRALKERGLAQESGGLWLALRGVSEQKLAGNPADVQEETGGESPGNPAETPRKPTMDTPGDDVQDGETPDPKEGSEGTEGKKEQTPPPPQGDQGGESGSSQDQSQTSTPARARRAPIPPPQLPADLAEVPGLSLAWEKWLRYRVEASIKTTESTAEEQFRKLRALGQAGEDLPAAVARAIEFGWKSFFPSKDRPRPAAPPAAQVTDDPTPSMAELLASAPLHPQRKVS